MFSPLYLCASTINDADLDTRIDAAVAGGYDGIGLRPGHLAQAAADGFTAADVRHRLSDAGLELVEIGFLADWWLTGEEAAKSRAHEEELYRLKDALGGRHMMVIGGPLDEPVEIVGQRLAGVCDRAARAGLTVALEFLPWTDTSTITTAWSIVEAAERPNVGIVMDTWHQFRGGGTLAEIDAVPADRIVAVQLSDGPVAPVGSELDDTFHRRMLPGQGEFDLVGVLAGLYRRGIDVPLGVEVLSDELRALPPRVAARTAARATRALLDSLPVG